MLYFNKYVIFTVGAVKMEISDISKVIKYHRKRSGLTQEELADLAGIGKTVVFDIEQGKETVQMRTLWLICTALNISVNFSSPLMEEYYASM